MKQRQTRQRRTIFLTSTVILASIALTVVILASTMQYRQAFRQRRDQLVETVKVHARLIEAVVRHGEMNRAKIHSADVRAATLSQIIDAHEHHGGFGRTGEFVLGQREGNQIIFLLRRPHPDDHEPLRIPWTGKDAQPMRYALSGRKGAVVGLDYRGNRVLAAFEPVEGIGLGVVAKIDTAEVRAPFVQAGIVTGTVAVLMIAVGSFCFFHIADPMVRRIEASEARQRAVRKRAEKALKRAHYELQLIFNAAEPLCVIDTDNHIVRVNDPFCELFDVRREEVLGKKCCDLWHSSKCHAKRCALKRIVGGVERVDYELDQRRDDGTVVSCAVTAFPYCDPGGRLLGIVKNFVDITQRKQAEELLKEKNNDLETLFYVTSHDLREPLRTIQNFAELIDHRYADRLDRKARDFLGRIIRGANRLDRLVTDILTLSRAGRMVTPSEWVDAAEIVDDVLQRLETKILESRAMVFVTSELPRLYVDRIWATQAVYNLVANALKFTRDGESPIVEIEAYESGGGKAESGKETAQKSDLPSAGPLSPFRSPLRGIVVRDCGPGILPEYRQRIFELFQRAVGRDVEGTGAGLAIVQQIARRHGGDVRVEPAPTGGSEFILTFATPPCPPPQPRTRMMAAEVRNDHSVTSVEL